jgi:hypothetical protein
VVRRLEGGHQRHLLVHRGWHGHVVVVRVAEEGLNVVAGAVLLVGLLLWHNHANHVGLSHGGVVSGGHEVDGVAVRAQGRTDRRFDCGNVDGLRLQQSHCLARRVLCHLQYLLLLVRRHRRCQRPRLLLRLPRPGGRARAAVHDLERLAEPLGLLCLHDRLRRCHERRCVARLLAGQLLRPAHGLPFIFYKLKKDIFKFDFFWKKLYIEIMMYTSSVQYLYTKYFVL